MQLRRHQAELQQIGRKIAGGSYKKITICDVTPGGGKSAAISLFARELLETRKINHVLWACPRKALVGQCYDAWQQYSGYDNSFLTPVHYGYLGKEHLELTLSKDVLLVCDELQFLADMDENDGAWTSKTKDLLERSKYFLGVSGTLFRSTPGKLLGVEYKDGKDLIGNEYKSGLIYATSDVGYSLRDALADKAVVEFDINQELGQFEAPDTNETLDLHSEASKKYLGILQPILENASVWKPRVDDCVTQWLEYRRSHYASKCIVVASSQSHAKVIHEYMVKRFRVNATLAISDNEDAQQQIKIFQSRSSGSNPRCLITVAMASVGLDVVDATHMAYLSHYRFDGFMLQAWARVSRVNYKCGLNVDQQRAFIYTIRDYKMDRFCEWIKSQSPRGKLADQGTCGGGGGGDGPQEKIVINGWLTGEKEFDSSKLEPSISGPLAMATAAVIDACPAAGSLDKAILSKLAGSIDINKLRSTATTAVQDEPSIKKIEGGDALKADAIRKFVDIVCRRIAQDDGEEHSHVRTEFQGHGVSISDFSYPDQLLGLFVRCAEAAAVRGFRDLGLVYQNKADWDETKKQSKKQKNEDMAVIITEILHEFGYPIQVTARRRSNA